MELSQLRYFLEVVRLGSITGAARSLGVSQPTLSVAMRQLEQSFDASLLLRHRSGTSVTAAGEELSVHAREVFHILDRATSAIASLGEDLVGQFTLGCHEFLGAYFLPHLLPNVLQGAPRVSLTLHNASSADVQAAVINREIHFGLVVNPTVHPELVMVPIFDDAVDFFVCSDGRSAEEGAASSLAEAYERIRRDPLIYAGRVSQCADLLSRLADRGVVPERTLVCGDFGLVKSLARSDVGVAMLPRRIANHRSEGELVRLHDGLPYFPDRIVLIYRADQPKTRAAAFLKQAVVRAGGEMPNLGPT